jgi:hypothetical protein
MGYSTLWSGRYVTYNKVVHCSTANVFHPIDVHQKRSYKHNSLREILTPKPYYESSLSLKPQSYQGFKKAYANPVCLLTPGRN